ncbi:MAG: carotenoid oxygenase family protein [Bryobacteraceae bacterium]
MSAPQEQHQTTQDLAPGLEKVFQPVSWEGSAKLSGITGTVPSWLRGSYYLNGPARFVRDGMQYKHWLDGDGMVRALHFGEDGVQFVARFVESIKLKDEREAGKFLYRGFGTSFPGDQLRHKLMLEPPINVSVYPTAGKLLALGEQALPYELDRMTLETKGEFDFNGSLNAVSPFAAHAKLDGHMVNFGVSFSATQPQLNVYEFDKHGTMLKRRRHALQHQFSIHDFGITPTRTIFFLSPLIMDFQRFWGKGVSVMESLDWRPELGSDLLIMPRAGSNAKSFQVRAGNKYALHFINCFEEGNLLTVDMLELDEPVYKEYEPLPDVFATATPARPVRFVIDCDAQKLIGRTEMDYTLTPDFPSINPDLAGKQYNDFWMLGISEAGKPGRKFFDELVHGSWANGPGDKYRVPKGEYLGGEPAFAGNNSEGVIISQHYAPEKGICEYLLFDAFNVSKGPIAQLPLPGFTHPGFHSCFHKWE